MEALLEGPGGEKSIFPEVSKKWLYDVFKVFGGHLRVRSGILRYFEYRLGGEGGCIFRVYWGQGLEVLMEAVTCACGALGNAKRKQCNRQCSDSPSSQA